MEDATEVPHAVHGVMLKKAAGGFEELENRTLSLFGKKWFFSLVTLFNKVVAGHMRDFPKAEPSS